MERKSYLKLVDEATERATRAAVSSAFLVNETTSVKVGRGLKRVDATFGLGSSAETATYSLLVDSAKTDEQAIESACKLAARHDGVTPGGTSEVFLVAARVDGRTVFNLEGC